MAKFNPASQEHIELVTDSLRELVAEAERDETDYLGGLFASTIFGKTEIEEAVAMATKRMRGR